MDTLTFSSPILLRHLTFSEARKAPINEINLQKVLEGLQMDMSQVCNYNTTNDLDHSYFLQFIDLCILLGCDYLEPIRGVGPKSALKLIREYGGLGEVVEHLREKYAETLSSLHGHKSTHYSLFAGKQRKPRPQKMARRRKVESRSRNFGLGKKPRKYSKNRMCSQLTKLRYEIVRYPQLRKSYRSSLSSIGKRQMWMAWCNSL